MDKDSLSTCREAQRLRGIAIAWASEQDPARQAELDRSLRLAAIAYAEKVASTITKRE